MLGKTSSIHTLEGVNYVRKDTQLRSCIVTGGRADDIMHELNQHAAVVLSGRHQGTGNAATSSTSEKADANAKAASDMKQRERDGCLLDDLVVHKVSQSQLSEPMCRVGIVRINSLVKKQPLWWR